MNLQRMVVILGAGLGLISVTRPWWEFAAFAPPWWQILVVYGCLPVPLFTLILVACLFGDRRRPLRRRLLQIAVGFASASVVYTILRVNNDYRGFGVGRDPVSFNPFTSDPHVTFQLTTMPYLLVFASSCIIGACLCLNSRWRLLVRQSPSNPSDPA